MGKKGGKGKKKKKRKKRKKKKGKKEEGKRGNKGGEGGKKKEKKEKHVSGKTQRYGIPALQSFCQQPGTAPLRYATPALSPGSPTQKADRKCAAGRGPAPRLNSAHVTAGAPPGSPRVARRGVRAYVRTCVRGGATCRALPCREGEGAREEGGSRHLGASSRHNKAPSGSERIFLPGRGGARLVAVRTGQGAGVGAGLRERAGWAPPSGRALRPAARRGSAEAWRRRGPAIGAGGGGPRRERWGRGAGARGGAAAVLSAGPSGGTAGGGRSIVRGREVPVWRSCFGRAALGPPRGSGAAPLRTALGAPPQCGPGPPETMGAVRLPRADGAAALCGARPARLRRGAGIRAPQRDGMGLGAAAGLRPEGKVVLRGPVSAGPFVKWWRFLARSAVIRCVW